MRGNKIMLYLLVITKYLTWLLTNHRLIVGSEALASSGLCEAKASLPKQKTFI